MPEVAEKERQLTFTEKTPAWVRVLLCLVGLVPIILAPYELLVRPGWNGFGPAVILPVVISVGAVLVGGVFAAAGLSGLSQTLQFDADKRTAVHAYQSPVVPLRTRTYPFSSITSLQVQAQAGTDGPDVYRVQVAFTDGRKVAVGGTFKREEAEQARGRIERILRQ